MGYNEGQQQEMLVVGLLEVQKLWEKPDFLVEQPELAREPMLKLVEEQGEKEVYHPY